MGHLKNVTFFKTACTHSKIYAAIDLYQVCYSTSLLFNSAFCTRAGSSTISLVIELPNLTFLCSKCCLSVVYPSLFHEILSDSLVLEKISLSPCYLWVVYKCIDTSLVVLSISLLLHMRNPLLSIKSLLHQV